MELSCGLLAGWDRIHWSLAIVTLAGVAACLRAGIGYTPRRRFSPRRPVAACLRAGIGYTLNQISLYYPPVAACLRAGIGYTTTSSGKSAHAVAACLRAGIGYTVYYDGDFSALLRLACGLGSDTLLMDQAARVEGCGLLAGWDRIHSESMSESASGCCGLLAGWDRIH